MPHREKGREQNFVVGREEAMFGHRGKAAPGVIFKLWPPEGQKKNINREGPSSVRDRTEGGKSG